MHNYLFPLAIAMTAILSLSGDRPLTAFAAPLSLLPSEDMDVNVKSPLEVWAAGLDERDYKPAVVNYTNWSCKPSKDGANPIILLHGLMAYPPLQSTAYMAERLTQSGYCVYQLLYGVMPSSPDYGGMSDIQDSAKELSAFVEKVLDSAGASQVDLIGHSQGTVVARWYVKFLDKGNKVRSVVSVAPVGRGTTLQGLGSVFKVFTFFVTLESLVERYCPACMQLLKDSDLLKALYADNEEIVPGVRYLNILTREDQIVTPYTNGEMKLEDPHDINTVNAEFAAAAKEPSPSQNLIMEDYCLEAETTAEYSNHFTLFRSPFAVTAAEAFLAGKIGPLGKEDLPCASS
ncbi:hypothetical protein BGZ68_009249 [Mortierella alpina]|nr:hypothetical protein BGZ68_009249 [Mortierella alpina]